MIDKLDFIKIKNFCSLKDRKSKLDWENSLQISYLIKDLYLQYIKDYQNSKENEPNLKVD